MDTVTPAKVSVLRPLIFLGLVAIILAVVYGFHLQQYLEKERLRQWIAGYGMWGPLVYLLVWFLAPPLFLPGLPITLAGGILFGPFWGVVYTAIGSCGGATLAFLVARYLVRHWVAHKIAGTRLAHLDEKVASQGWEIVAFTRLIPIFPFFLLNYAFGLTRISLKAYVVATFLGMLPVTIAYVYFAANVLDLLHGKFSRGLIIGFLMLALVSLIPFVYKKFKARRGEPSEF